MVRGLKMVQMGDMQTNTAMLQFKLLFYEYQRCHVLVAMAPNGYLNTFAWGNEYEKSSFNDCNTGYDLCCCCWNCFCSGRDS